MSIFKIIGLFVYLLGVGVFVWWIMRPPIIDDKKETDYPTIDDLIN